MRSNSKRLMIVDESHKDFRKVSSNPQKNKSSHCKSHFVMLQEKLSYVIFRGLIMNNLNNQYWHIWLAYKNNPFDLYTTRQLKKVTNIVGFAHKSGLYQENDFRFER